MSTYQSYSQRHARNKSSTKLASVSPSKSNVLQMQNQHNKITGVSNFTSNCESVLNNPNTIGGVVSKLTDRVDSIEVKMTSLTNIVKLMQKYTESKDQQYEKQKQNFDFKSQLPQNQRNEWKKSEFCVNGKSINPFDAIDIDLNNKIKQFDLLTKRMKSELSAVQSLRIGLCRQSSQKLIETNYKSTSNNTNPPKGLQLQEIQQMIQNVQEALRDELNRKIQICMNTFKALCNHQNSQNTQSTKINRTMLQQQIHTLTLNFNKMENEQHKNITFILNKVQDISKHVNRMSLLKVNQENDQVRLTAKNGSLNKRKQSLTPRSNRSQKSVSKSKNKKKKNPQLSSNLSLLNLSEKTKVKQDQLKQAIRRKRQTKQKLKVK